MLRTCRHALTRVAWSATLQAVVHPEQHDVTGAHLWDETHTSALLLCMDRFSSAAPNTE